MDGYQLSHSSTSDGSREEAVGGSGQGPCGPCLNPLLCSRRKRRGRHTRLPERCHRCFLTPSAPVSTLQSIAIDEEAHGEGNPESRQKDALYSPFRFQLKMCQRSRETSRPTLHSSLNYKSFANMLRNGS